jgi:3-oxoacyl-[acyl-carrier protein] reductase
LDGRAVLVTHTATRLGHDLAAALVDLGASVTEVADSCADRATADKAFARAATLDAVVHVCVDEAGLTAQPLVDTTPGEWDARSETLLRDAIVTFQAAHARFASSGSGRIVLIAPSAGFTGAGGFVPATTAVEGVRALAKSAARQWGPQGITVNAVLVPPELVAPELASATTFNAPPVTGRLPDPRDDIAAAIALFVAPSANGITGSTVIVDGGSVMAP